MIRFSLMMFLTNLDLKRECLLSVARHMAVTSGLTHTLLHLFLRLPELLTARRLLTHHALSYAWVHLSRRLDCARLIPQHDCQGRKIVEHHHPLGPCFVRIRLIK